MKKVIHTAALFTALGGSAFAEWSVGNGAIQAETRLTAAYDSNLRSSAYAIDDYYLDLQPMLRYRRTNARFATNASAGVDIKRFLDYPEINRNDAQARFDWRMERTVDDTVGVEVDLNYFENSDAVPDINERVRSRNFSATASGEMLVARRSLLSGSVTYRDSRRDVASDQTAANVRAGYSYVGFTDGTILRFNYSYQRSKTTDSFTDARELDQTAQTASTTLSRPLYDDFTGALTAGYRWLDRGQQEALAGLEDAHGAYVGLNFSGPFLPRRYFPKTTGTFRIAYEQAEVPGINDRSNERLVGEIDITWQPRERTKVDVFARRTQDLTVNDNTVINATGGFRVTQDVGSFTQAEIGGSYTNAYFTGWHRSDDRYEAHVGANYQMNRHWSARVTYSYLDSSSSAAIANFDRHIVMLSLAYAF